MNITRAELKAAIDEAHRRASEDHRPSVLGRPIPKPPRSGIDDLEHGFFVNTQLDPGQAARQMLRRARASPTLLAMKPGSPEANALIKLLVDHHVAMTSTLPVFEQALPLHAPLSPKAMDVLTPEARERLSLHRATSQRHAARRRARQAFAQAYRTTWASSASSSPRAGC